MDPIAIVEANAWLEKSNAGLEPELLGSTEVSEMVRAYARAEKLAAFGKTMLARKMDADAVARASGTSVGKAKAAVETAKSLEEAPLVRAAFQGGDVSLDQASEIARAEAARPGAATELLSVAKTESFQVLRERSRKVVLEAEQSRGLPERQREARSGRDYTDELGMMNIHLRLRPHVGVPLMKRAHTEANRLFREAKKSGSEEPFERHLADAYASMLAGGGKPHQKKPEM